MEELQSRVDAIVLGFVLLFLVGFGAAAYFIASLKRVAKKLETMDSYTRATRKMTVDSVSEWERSLAGMKEHYKNMLKLSESQSTINKRTVRGLDGLRQDVERLTGVVDDILDYVTDDTEVNDPYLVTVMQHGEPIAAYATHDLETPIAEVMAVNKDVQEPEQAKDYDTLLNDEISVQDSVISRAAQLLRR
ncbi:hypothetical protein ACRXCV_00340 (plasmid) [Halobacteriovorax sp. GFR7]|uniref:hypothetical protein n=1 Tax=unclassified Halobacteriovorax TaxID=2639665 RepID=UPI003D96F297